MPQEVYIFISNYGYLAIFCIIFSQEIGIPNPVPNELVLMYAGYLTYKGIIWMPFAILTALSADFIGTNILYFTFYFFGTYALKRKPRWFPLSEKVIDRLTIRLTNGGKWAIYLGRITPFIRGYTSLITGLLQVKPKIFLPIALISATIWSSTCIITGRILGPYWSLVQGKLGIVKCIIIVAVLVILITLLIKYFQNRRIKED